MEPVQVDCEVRNGEILKIERVSMEEIERWLIKTVKYDLTIAAWVSSAERKFKEYVDRDVFQIDISLKSHHLEFFTELLEICGSGDRYYKDKNISFEKGESSSV